MNSAQAIRLSNAVFTAELSVNVDHTIPAHLTVFNEAGMSVWYKAAVNTKKGRESLLRSACTAGYSMANTRCKTLHVTQGI